MLTVSKEAVAAGITKPGSGISDVSALVIEIVFTAIFVMVILSSSKRAPQIAGLAIPLTLVAIHFAIAPLTGSSVNPARSIGSGPHRRRPDRALDLPRRPDLGGVIGSLIYRVTASGEDEPAAI